MKNQDSVNENSASINVRVPKRVLHFSDGVVEEYSDDEVDTPPKNPEQEAGEALVDPKTLHWGPWMMYAMWTAGSSTLSACDYLGESLASFFGITTPKYHFEIEEHKRREEEQKQYEEQQKGWVANEEVKLSQPFPSSDQLGGPTPV